jgi:NhaP-type Na+/H+ or K+/H+ antiporter
LERERILGDFTYAVLGVILLGALIFYFRHWLKKKQEGRTRRVKGIKKAVLHDRLLESIEIKSNV